MDNVTTVPHEQQTISVWLDNSEPDVLKKFHCLYCGKTLFEFYDNVKLVMPGEMGEVKKAAKVIQCGNKTERYKNGETFTATCKAKYWVE